MERPEMSGLRLGVAALAAWVWIAGVAPLYAADPPEDLPRRRYALKDRKDEVIGGTYFRHRATAHDTMIILARDNHMGFNEIMLANPDQDPWSPRVGSKIRMDFRKVLPGLNNPAKIVVNLPEMRIYHFRGDRIETYPIGVGQEGMMTPRVRTAVTSKMADPVWRPPASIRKEDPSLPEAIYPGPRNPLGTHAIYLSLPAYLMHGTNRPLGVGRRVSHGCIRLYPEDIIEFFPNVNAGDSVAIVNEPAKAGWRDGELYLEIHPILADLKHEGSLRVMMEKAVKQALTRRPDLRAVVDWRLAERMADNPDGQSRRIAVAEGSNPAARDKYLTVPEIPDEQTIPEGGLKLPDLERLDREDGNPAAIRIDQPVPKTHMERKGAKPNSGSVWPPAGDDSGAEPMPAIAPEPPPASIADPAFEPQLESEPEELPLESASDPADAPGQGAVPPDYVPPPQ
ncbi:MAG: L,D-transpeptidase family protein [Magnetococcales bacterium]|nr:L,D-transpeptidase family protein [Magnetococcales bacterium]